MATFFKRSYATLSAPTLKQATTDPCLCWRLLDTPGKVWVSLLWGQCSFLLGPGTHKFCLCSPRVCFPVLCKFWQLCGGVNGDLLQEGLCHTQVYCTQSPCPCGRLLLTHTSTGDTQTLKGRSGSVSVGSLGPGTHKVLFEPSTHLWQVWGFDSKPDFTPPTILLGCLLCPWTCGIFFWWDPTFSYRWLFSSVL